MADKPFGSYDWAVKVLNKQGGSVSGITRGDAVRTLCTTPGLFFPPGTDLGTVVSRLVNWGMLTEKDGKLFPVRR